MGEKSRTESLLGDHRGDWEKVLRKEKLGEKCCNNNSTRGFGDLGGDLTGGLGGMMVRTSFRGLGAKGGFTGFEKKGRGEKGGDPPPAIPNPPSEKENDPNKGGGR